MPIPKLKTQSGQIFLEYLLLMVVSVTILFYVVNSLKKMEYLQDLTVNPWSRVDGMAECGVWVVCGLDTPNPAQHPNTSTRILSFNPLESQ